MKHNYTGLWCILAAAFGIFAILSVFDTISIGGFELKSSGISDELFSRRPKASATLTAGGDSPDKESASEAKAEPAPLDTASQTILFIGDSMLEGLSPRLAAYCEKNGHELYSVIWYSSTSEVWGRSDKLKHYISTIKPTYVFVSLGANELFVSNIAEKRDKYVKKIVADIGDLPFVWIGPPNWKPDTGINSLIAANAPSGSYFKSDGMHFDRAKDGAHPTRKSAAEWMDSVARWMPLHSAHPIRMEKPSSSKGRPRRIFVHQPSEH